jgi:hypothetical protein
MAWQVRGVKGIYLVLNFRTGAWQKYKNLKDAPPEHQAALKALTTGWRARENEHAGMDPPR